MRGPARPATPGGSGEDGTILPVVLGFFLVACLLVLLGASASSAFLAQRDLVAFCDSVAVAAADSVGERGLFDGSAARRTRLPLSESSVDAVVADLRSARPDVAVDASVRGADDDLVAVSCATTADVSFGSLFGRPTVERRATATARSPYDT